MYNVDVKDCTAHSPKYKKKEVNLPAAGVLENKKTLSPHTAGTSSKLVSNEDETLFRTKMNLKVKSENC